MCNGCNCLCNGRFAVSRDMGLQEVEVFQSTLANE